MRSYIYVAIVTAIALLVYAWMATRVSAARRKTGVRAPAVTGDPLLERTIRAHYNTLEWMPIFLTSLWLFAVYWNEMVAALLGLLWVIGRIVYFVGYVTEASKRRVGFLIQALAAGVLLLGALGRLIYLAVVPA